MAVAQRELSTITSNPNDYVRSGFLLVDKQCSIFFDSLIEHHNVAQLARRQLTLGGAAAAGILSAVSAGVQTITIVGIAVPLAANLIESFQDFALITPYPIETSILVQSAMATYKNSATQPADIYHAAQLIQGYASLCTYAGVSKLARQAIATAKTSNQQQTPPIPALAPAPPPAQGVRKLDAIPNIVVNQ